MFVLEDIAQLLYFKRDMDRGTLLALLIVMSILGVIYVSVSGSVSQAPEKLGGNQIFSFRTNTTEAQPNNLPSTTNAPIQKVQTPSKSPSQYAEFLASYIVINANKQSQDLLIEKFAPGTNNLATAKYNFALALDNNQNLLVRTEALVFQNLSGNMSESSGYSNSEYPRIDNQLDEINSKLDDFETRERNECMDRGGFYTSTFGCH